MGVVITNEDPYSVNIEELTIDEFAQILLALRCSSPTHPDFSVVSAKLHEANREVSFRDVGDSGNNL